jgi:hypothetical protein
LGGLATVGGLAYANRDKLKQGASYVKRKAGSAYGAARQKAGQVYGKAKGMARNVYEQVATHPRNPF